MTFEQLIKHFGTQQKTADALGLAQSTVSDWKYGIPEGRQYQIQVITVGILQADKRA